MKDKKLIINFIMLSCIILSISLLSIGYAALTSIELNIEGVAIAKQQEGMYISDIYYLDDVNADVSSSEIVEFIGTMLHSDIYLSPTDTTSSITYELTIINNSDALKQFKGITYSSEFYSNDSITYELIGFDEGELIEKGESKTFSLRFYYDGITEVIDNNLDSYLNFEFDYYFEEENEVDIKITEHGEYPFAGVDQDNPVSLANIANIVFSVSNGADEDITSISVKIIYTTTTGSIQSAVINLLDENGKLITSELAQFEKKQTNATTTVTFTNFKIASDETVTVALDKNTITNGQVSITGITLVVD